ncbi:hypothetical protein, partial [Mucilaginibacter sp.]|uniref:hypothetical protein n=1 Tax=Mucilaginibacter sp. TaxID=1882438 RepID=UPI0026208B32
MFHTIPAPGAQAIPLSLEFCFPPYRLVIVAQLDKSAMAKIKFFEILIKILVFSILGYAREKDASGK